MFFRFAAHGASKAPTDVPTARHMPEAEVFEIRVRIEDFAPVSRRRLARLNEREHLDEPLLGDFHGIPLMAQIWHRRARSPMQAAPERREADGLVVPINQGVPRGSAAAES